MKKFLFLKPITLRVIIVGRIERLSNIERDSFGLIINVKFIISVVGFKGVEMLGELEWDFLYYLMGTFLDFNESEL